MSVAALILLAMMGAGASATVAPAAAVGLAPDRARRYEVWRATHLDIAARLEGTRTNTRNYAAAERSRPGDTHAGAVEQAPTVFDPEDVGAVIWECAACPELVLVPAGAFTIGSRDDELNRTQDEGPRRRVVLAEPFALGRFEVTRGEYETFLRETGHPVSGNCVTDRAQPGTWAPDARTNLRDPAFAQTDDHPVVCVSWDDAQAYVAWLNTKTGGGYRLPSEAEWEWARGGSTSAYPWGPSVDGGCPHANIADETAGVKYPTWPVARCRDGALNTAPVGSYLPNAFGLYDMIGNVEEWIRDCATTSYDAMTGDGSAVLGGDCARHIVRSSSWGALPADARTANRIRYPRGQVDDSIGFRVARTLVRPDPASRRPRR